MKNIREAFVLPVIACVTALSAPVATARDAIRYTTPGAPMAQAVEVPAGQGLVFLSGTVPGVADKAAPKDSVQAFGDMKTQTVSVLDKIDAALRLRGLGMRDVVKMQVFLVGDATHGGKMDFAGFMEGYRLFFGTKQQPNLPARAVVKVAGLVNPGWLVEIEVTAMRK